MPLLLTYFHLYLRKHVLQDNIQNQVEKAQNKAKSAKQKANFRNAQRRRMEEPNFTLQLGPSTTAGGVQAQPPAHLSKAVASGARQGAVALPPTRLEPLFLKRFLDCMQRRFCIVSYFTLAKPTTN
jgi:hypothetical protein